MTFYSRAPLRIGLAGGGTDVTPYCDVYGGAVVNATISLYAHACIELQDNSIIMLEATDLNESASFNTSDLLPINGTLDLHKAVYNRFQKDHGLINKGFRLSTHVDAPAGSGLGTSSTLVVALVAVFAEWVQIPMSKTDIASYAYEIERTDLGFSGGHQDQYAACFGGFNFMEFSAGNKVTVQPLSVPSAFARQLEKNLLLYFTNSSRNSSHIIEEQMENVRQHNTKSIEAMHHLKEQAQLLKAVLQNGEPDDLGPLLNFGFMHKKNMASNISNQKIDALYEAAIKAGATGGKISGAGGGGFMVFYCPGSTRATVEQALQLLGGEVKEYQFEPNGFITWRD